jgi:hypothetical protein
MLQLIFHLSLLISHFSLSDVRLKFGQSLPLKNGTRHVSPVGLMEMKNGTMENDKWKMN